MYLVGSLPSLGAWDAYNKGIKLTWSEGHLWRVTLPLDATFPSLTSLAEYKFIIKQGGKFVRWEEGRNHHLNLEQVQRQIADALRQQRDLSRPLELGKLSDDTVRVIFSKKVLQFHAFWHDK